MVNQVHEAQAEIQDPKTYKVQYNVKHNKTQKEQENQRLQVDSLGQGRCRVWTLRRIAWR